MIFVGMFFALIGLVLGWAEVVRYSYGYPRNWGLFMSGVILCIIGLVTMWMAIQGMKQ